MMATKTLTTFVEVWHFDAWPGGAPVARIANSAVRSSPFFADMRECQQILAGHHPEYRYKLVALVGVLFGATSFETDDALEKAWELTNSIDRPWQQNLGVVPFGSPNRSSSMGDMLVLNGQRYLCVAIGFEPMDMREYR
jgi:hypothetical protein